MNPDDTSQSQRNQAKAGFYLCLARAFSLPQMSDAFFAAFRQDLAHDLAELGGASGYPVGGAIENFTRAMTGVADAQDLQVIYARLFLTPGDQHPTLNAGSYLDGAVAGSSVNAMATCYQRCGLEKHEALHDLPDHVAVQLEFVAWLYAAQAEGGANLPFSAEDFISSFVVRWASAFRAATEAATEHFGLMANPYAALARLVEIAAQADARLHEAAKQTVDPEIARLRAEFAGRMLDTTDIDIIRARLDADGLDAAHVVIPLAQRDREMGLASLIPPVPPRHASAPST